MNKYIDVILDMFVNSICILPFLHRGLCHGPLAKQLLAGSRTVRLLLQLAQLIRTIKTTEAEGFHPSIHPPAYTFLKPVAKSFTEIFIDLKDLYFVPQKHLFN